MAPERLGLACLQQGQLRIGVAADSHGNWAALDGWAAAHRLDVVIHCGDCGVAPADGVPVWAARGNHDHAVHAGHAAGGTARGDRPSFVPDYHVLELGGLRWLFLGCGEGLAAVAAPPATLPAVDVLVSHEAPFNPHLGWPGHPVVRAVVEQARPRWCFSGHWHRAARTVLGATRCFALGDDPAGWLVAEVRDATLHFAPAR